MIVKTKVGKDAWAFLGDVEEIKQDNNPEILDECKVYEREDLDEEEQGNYGKNRTGKVYQIIYASGKAKHCLFWETTYLLNDSGKTVEKLN